MSNSNNNLSHNKQRASTHGIQKRPQTCASWNITHWFGCGRRSIRRGDHHHQRSSQCPLDVVDSSSVCERSLSCNAFHNIGINKNAHIRTKYSHINNKFPHNRNIRLILLIIFHDSMAGAIPPNKHTMAPKNLTLEPKTLTLMAPIFLTFRTIKLTVATISLTINSLVIVLISILNSLVSWFKGWFFNIKANGLTKSTKIMGGAICSQKSIVSLFGFDPSWVVSIFGLTNSHCSDRLP